MKQTLRIPYARRLYLWLLGYSAIILGCFLIFQYHREREFKSAELDAQLQIVNSYILNELERGKEMKDVSLDGLHSFGDLRVSVIDGKGNVIYDNSLDALPHDSHLRRQEIRDALSRGTGFTVRRHSQSTGRTYFYSARKGENGYVVRTAVPYSVTLSSLLQADYGFIWFMCVVTLVMCVLGFFATRRLGQHISRLNRFAENAEKGLRIYDTEPFPHDELGDISNHIVRLYASLQKAVADRDREHSAALKQEREKERIKRQLTDNINHELKTPVASIRVCLETLLTHPYLSREKREAFLKRSFTNIDRLSKLLADVALITRMTEGGDAIARSRVDLTSLIIDTIQDCRPAAQRAEIEIKMDIERELKMRGNAQLLTSVFHNLIDNAIAYSGGSEICISVKQANTKRCTLTVSDNGTGVDPVHLPRIFERFYRVDKGRSRAAGGTGLGLSIVKNAVLLHDGKISVENRPTGGLLFTITFPLVY